MDDKTALEDMRNGGKAGFETLYKRYFPKLRSRVLQLLTKYNTSKQITDIADEICQEVFYFGFYQNIDAFEEKCSVMTWLSNLAYNKTIDYLRKEEKEQPTTWLSKKIKEKDLQKEPVFHKGKSLKEEEEETFFGMGIEATEQEEKIFCYAECIGKALKKSDVDNDGCLSALIFSLQKQSIEDIAKEIGISHKEAKAFLNRCKRKLKNRPNCLTALMLSYALELSQNEMATVLAKKPGTVGVFLLDCRKKMKKDINFKSCCEECGYLLKEKDDVN
jgi:RNA polymerase sigma factor (sigma-70 family)